MREDPYVYGGSTDMELELEDRLRERRDESLLLVDKVTQLVEETKCESYFEWPKKNDGWKQPREEELMKSMPHFTAFDGCAYGLKNADGKSMRKTWQVASTHGRIKDYLNKTCTCKEEHAQVRGKDGKATEEYTKDMINVIVQCLINQEVSLKPVRKNQ